MDSRNDEVCMKFWLAWRLAGRPELPEECCTAPECCPEDLSSYEQLFEEKDCRACRIYKWMDKARKEVSKMKAGTIKVKKKVKSTASKESPMTATEVNRARERGYIKEKAIEVERANVSKISGPEVMTESNLKEFIQATRKIAIAYMLKELYAEVCIEGEYKKRHKAPLDGPIDDKRVNSLLEELQVLASSPFVSNTKAYDKLYFNIRNWPEEHIEDNMHAIKQAIKEFGVEEEYEAS